MSIDEAVMGAPVFRLLFFLIGSGALVVGVFFCFKHFVQMIRDRTLAQERSVRYQSRLVVGEWMRMDPHEFEHEVE